MRRTATKKRAAQTTKIAAKKRAARRRAAQRRNTRPRDPLSQALVRAMTVEEKAVKEAGEAGVTAINAVENISRQLFGVPATKTRKAGQRSRRKAKTSVVHRPKSKASKRLAA